MHVYQNFYGGLNTVDSNEKIADVELTDLKNIDLGDRGSLKRRHGMVKHIASIETGNGQGYFRYYKEGVGYEEITAQNGYLFKDGVQQGIQDLPRFQTTRPIEAVQFRDKLYIATGSKLVEYDGVGFKVVEPYAPEPLEALYVGTNALADDPDNFMQNGEGTHLRVDGVTFNRRYGIVNTPITLSVFVTKPIDSTIEYLYEYRTPSMKEGFWEQLTDGAYISESTFTFELDIEGDISLRVWAKEVGQTEGFAKQYLIPKYKIKPVPDPNDQEVPNNTIHECNRILLHWDRLIIYGDTGQPDAIFISHLNNPNYFPVPNSLVFESERRERITSIVRYRNILVVFTPSTIQALFGKSPMDYHRVMLNSRIGCIAPYSTSIVGNFIAFLSNEGVHFLKSVDYTESRMNVEKIDVKIDNIMMKDTNACGALADNQYMLVFPSKNIRLRFYYENGTWTKDESEKLDFNRMYEWDGVLYGQSLNEGSVYKFDKTVFTDDGLAYEDRIETKYYDFSEPYHEKKLKELQMIMGSQNQRTSISTYVYADESLIVDTNTSYAEITADGSVQWVYENEPNVHLKGGTELGKWEFGESSFGVVATEKYFIRLSGRCRRTKIVLSHTDQTPIQLLGLGYIFKTKRP